MSNLNSIIVLSGLLTPQLELDQESQQRVDEGIRLLGNGVADKIIMNGGPGRLTEPIDGNGYLPRGSHPVHSEVMREYALGKGVHPEKVITQEYSSDSVGEAYFVKEGILVPRSWNKEIIVTSKHHLSRTQKIYQHILGPNFSLDFVGVPTPKDEDFMIREHEVKALELFLDQFGDINAGDSRAIEERLYHVHNLYSRIPVEERLLFHSGHN